MAPNVPVEGISAAGVGSESAESYAAAAAAASPAGAAEAGSPETSQNERLLATRASATGAATTSIDSEAEGADGGATDQPSAGRARSSPGPASLNTISAHQNSPTPSPYSRDSTDPIASLNANPTSPGPTDAVSQDPVDMDAFLQILDLDEEDNHDFSRGMAFAYFEQAASTFRNMDEAFAKSSLPTLSSLGHFLKGSSAALGVYKVQLSCEKIQHYGELRDEDCKVDLEAQEALRRIGQVLTHVKDEYAEAEAWLKAYFAELD